MPTIKVYTTLCILLLFCVSCSLYSALRRKEFTYTAANEQQTLRLLVPKRYAKVENDTDSAGNPQRLYRYGNGAVLYIIQTTDTVTLFQPIDTTNHVPLQHPYGGIMYKGIDSMGLFWREIRTDSFRFGYRFVPSGVEPLFDSAVNFAGMRRFK